MWTCGGVRPGQAGSARPSREEESGGGPVVGGGGGGVVGGWRRTGKRLQRQKGKGGRKWGPGQARPGEARRADQMRRRRESKRKKRKGGEMSVRPSPPTATKLLFFLWSSPPTIPTDQPRSRLHVNNYSPTYYLHCSISERVRGRCVLA